MFRFFSMISVLLAFAFSAPAQRHAFDDARAMVNQVQNDLRHAARFEQRDKERERYSNAQHHLSEFDRALSKGKFDKDKLDSAIDDVKNVVEHNTLTPDYRDILTRDLQDLRVLRERRGVM